MKFPPFFTSHPPIMYKSTSKLRNACIYSIKSSITTRQIVSGATNSKTFTSASAVKKPAPTTSKPAAAKPNFSRSTAAPIKSTPIKSTPIKSSSTSSSSSSTFKPKFSYTKKPAPAPVSFDAPPISETEELSIPQTASTTVEFAEGSLPGEVFNDQWGLSYKGLGSEPFSKEVSDILWAELDSTEVEIKPDGLLYLPEIKYRRILNRAFGPGGWGLVPWSQTWISSRMVSREYGLVCHGRLIGISRGEQDYFDPNGVPTAMEGCKSNALMRCCKDLGIASELWDPNYIITFKKKFCESKFFEQKRRYLWKRKDRDWK